MAEHLQVLTREKFGNIDNNTDFQGPSDPSMAPPELRLYGGHKEIVIKNVMSEPDEVGRSSMGWVIQL